MTAQQREEWSEQSAWGTGLVHDEGAEGSPQILTQGPEGRVCGNERKPEVQNWFAVILHIRFMFSTYTAVTNLTITGLQAARPWFGTVTLLKN